MNRRILAGSLTLGTLLLVLLACKYGPEPTQAQAAQPPAETDQPVSMPANLTGVLLTLGLKDQSPTDWDGEITVAGGKLLALDVVQGNPKAAIKGGKFTIRSTAPKKEEKKAKEPVTKPVLRLTVDAPGTARIKVATKHGDFEFTLNDLPAPGTSQHFLQDQIAVAREDGALRLTRGETESDYPALARAADGTLWLAYAEYRKGKPYLAERVLAGDFDALVPKGNGDQVRLKHYDGKTWSAAVDVTEAGLDIWRPTVTVADGNVHVSWSQQVAGNWDIYHRVYSPAAKAGAKGKWSATVRLTSDAGTDFNVVSTTSASGQIWVAWQAWRQGHFQIVARKLGFTAGKVDTVAPEVALTTAKANHWNPAIAADSTGKVYVGYDTYEKDNYDVRVAEISGADIRTFDIAATARFEARVSLACDKENRLWVAYEEGDEQWGKDFSNAAMFRKIGFEGNPGNALYVKRTVRVKCLADGKVMQPAADLQAALVERTANNKSVPRVALDGSGGVWLLYRHHPRVFGTGEVWNSYAVRFNGKQWSTPRHLAHSDNLMDNRPAVLAYGQGLMVVLSGDARFNQQNRKTNDLFATLLSGATTHPAELVADPPAPKTKLKTVHPNETQDVARMRTYRLEHQGKKLHLFRGEFHRHTEYTAHRDGDGLLEDSWRYALDAGNLDWMGNADHDNGHHDEYSWWQIQKFADLMHHAPTFVAAQTYERSVKYPDGHRNVMFPKRGIRPLPRGSLQGTEDKGTPDTKILYQYLKHFGGMCSSHTSGTDMGTDWRDNDPVYEPVVEIYQGHRHNYEFFGAPRSATEQTQIGGYQPKGFVVHALDKGYKLGFQSSSDHVSTHISYGVVLTDDLSRQGIIDAFKLRHSYAATDNIIVEFHCDKYIMGDIFDLEKMPAFTIKVLGTAPVAKVSIIRDGKYLHVEEPTKKQDVELTFTDKSPVVGKTSYYYVRIEQSDGNLAWASPMWITHKPK